MPLSQYFPQTLQVFLYEKHGRAVPIAARRLAAVAGVLAGGVGAAERVDLGEIVGRALRLGLGGDHEARGEEELHHRVMVVWCVDVGLVKVGGRSAALDRSPRKAATDQSCFRRRGR